MSREFVRGKSWGHEPKSSGPNPYSRLFPFFSIKTGVVDGLGSFFRVVGSNPTGCILTILISAQARQGRVQDFRRRNHESHCSPMATLALSNPDLEVLGSIPASCAFRFFGFSYLLFAFCREVAHLTCLDHLGRFGEYSNSPLFSPFGFPRWEKNASATKFFQRELFVASELFLSH